MLISRRKLLEWSAATGLAGGGGSVAPGAGALVWTGFPPVVTGGTLLPAPGVGALAWDGPAPSVSAILNPLLPGAGALTWTGFSPTVSGLTSPCAWSAADAAGHFTLTNNDLTIRRSTSADGYRSAKITTSKTVGKHYLELKCAVAGGNAFIILGFGNAGMSIASPPGLSASSTGVSVAARYVNGFTAGTDARLSGGNPSTDDVYNFAIDMDAGRCWVGYKNVWELSGDPAAGANPFATFTPGTPGALFFAVSLSDAAGGSDGTWTLQALSSDQTYSPPSGFSPWA